MASQFSFDVFSIGRLPTANGGDRLRKSSSMPPKQASPSTTRRGFLPRGIALEAWSSKSMKHSSSSPGTLRALADNPLKALKDVDVTCSNDGSRFFATPPPTADSGSRFYATPPPTAGKQRMRAIVYNWSAHYCKESLLQVTPGPVRAPYELAVGYDLRTRIHEFGKQKAYIMAFDAESLRKKFAQGMGVNPLEVTNSFMSRDSCCSDVIPLMNSHGRVTVKLQLENTSDSEIFVLLRVFRSANLKSEQDWHPVGDAVIVRVDQIADDTRKALEETIAAEAMEDEGSLTDHMIESLRKEMDDLAKLESLEELQKVEAELQNTQEELAEEAEQRKKQHVEAAEKLQETKNSVKELRDSLRLVQKATDEAEQKLAKLSTKKVDGTARSRRSRPELIN